MGEQAKKPTRQPNIILITADHLGTVHVAANGNPHMRTPNMDRLAEDGVSFTHFYTVGIACMPNRASLFTGRYPHSHGVIRNGVPLPETEMTLVDVLSAAGYVTGQMGKLHFWPHSKRNHRGYHPKYGFDEMRLSDEPGCYDDAYGLWLDAQGAEVRAKARVPMPKERKRLHYYTFAGDEKTTQAYWVASETIRFIRSYADQPFFVHAGFYAPHPPLNPPASQLARYDGVTFPPRKVKPGEMERMPRNYQRAAERVKGTTESVWTEYRKHFYAMVSMFDENVGRIIDAVDEAGLTDNTIFIVTSDHGDYLGNHGVVSKSNLIYEEVMNIPLLIAGPGVPRGRKADALAEIVDILPTVCALTGAELPAGVQGRSLVKAMSGGRGRDLVFMEGRGMYMIRTRLAKYAFYNRGSEVLFDLSRDPDEFVNLAGDPLAKELLDEMRKRAMAKVLSSMDPLPAHIAPY